VNSTPMLPMAMTIDSAVLVGCDNARVRSMDDAVSVTV